MGNGSMGNGSLGKGSVGNGSVGKGSMGEKDQWGMTAGKYQWEMMKEWGMGNGSMGNGQREMSDGKYRWGNINGEYQ